MTILIKVTAINVNGVDQDILRIGSCSFVYCVIIAILFVAESLGTSPMAYGQCLSLSINQLSISLIFPVKPG